jgi:hypothetical protein
VPVLLSDDSGFTAERAAARILFPEIAHNRPEVVVRDFEPENANKIKEKPMVASSTLFLVDSVSISGSYDPSTSDDQRWKPARSSTLPCWTIGQGEFDLLEQTCQSEDALWSRLGNWDL